MGRWRRWWRQLVPHVRAAVSALRAGHGPRLAVARLLPAFLAPPYRDLDGFLRFSIAHPVVPDPATPEDVQVIAAMDGLKRCLARRYAMEEAHLLVSIVLPTDGRSTTSRAIASVLSQSYPRWELLVVEHGPSRGTADPVRDLDDERITYHRLEGDAAGGVWAARNHGFRCSTGELVAHLDPDTVWDEHLLRVMVNEVAADPTRPSAYCARAVWRDGVPGADRSELVELRFAPFNRALLENRNYLDLNAFVHRREAHERYGGFDEELGSLADWDLLLRYTEEVAPVAVPCVMVHSGSRRSDGDGASDAVLAAFDRRHRGEILDDVPELERASGHDYHALRRRVPSGGSGRRIAVVVPSFEALDYLRTCLRSVAAHTEHIDHQLIVVDNASGERVRDHLASIRARGIIVELGRSNRGFTNAVNRGIALADDDRDVILLNNDALTTPGWVEGFWEVLERVPDVGVVVPRQVLPPGNRNTRTHVPYGDDRRELDVTISIQNRNVLDPALDPARGLVELSFAPFFCAYIPRRTIELVGDLDEESGPHYRSDRTYCDLVRRAGLRVVYTPHAKLYHFLQRSTTDLRRRDPAAYERLYVRNEPGDAVPGEDERSSSEGSHPSAHGTADDRPHG